MSLQHRSGVRHVAGESVTFLKLKVGEENHAGAVGNQRTQRNADHALFLIDFEYFCKSYEVDCKRLHLLRGNERRPPERSF